MVDVPEQAAVHNDVKQRSRANHSQCFDVAVARHISDVACDRRSSAKMKASHGHLLSCTRDWETCGRRTDPAHHGCIDPDPWTAPRSWKRVSESRRHQISNAENHPAKSWAAHDASETRACAYSS